MSQDVIAETLDQLDARREAVFAALEGLSEAQIWQRPAPREWCIGEILSHTARFFRSFLPFLRLMWTLCGWWGRLRRGRPYAVEIENVYERPNFPMWTGFLWTPRNNPKKPASLAALHEEVAAAHRRVRDFYTGKDPDVLGNVYAYDPAIGVVNLITGLKVGLDHDQLHYDDVFELAAALKAGRPPTEEAGLNP
jgi:hypothetical protein